MIRWKVEWTGFCVQKHMFRLMSQLKSRPLFYTESKNTNAILIREFIHIFGWKPYIMSHFQIQLKPFEMFCSSIVDTLCDQTLHFIEFKFKLNFRSTTNRKICMNNWAKLVLFRMKSCYNRNYKTNHYLPHTVWVAVFNKIYCHIFPVLSTLKLSIQ